MNCMKCGKKTKDTQVFCDACLEVMAQYPVKPDVHVQLPNRSPAKKASYKRPPSAEEQIIRLRSRIKRLKVLILLLMALLGIVGVALVYLAIVHGHMHWLTDFIQKNLFR